MSDLKKKELKRGQKAKKQRGFRNEVFHPSMHP
jgi:hypothetical protein